MSTRKEILILGYGEMGHAMQTLLEPFHEVSIWNRSAVDGKDFLVQQLRLLNLYQNTRDKTKLIV